MKVGRGLGALLLSPLALLLAVGVVAPTAILFAYSFFTMEAYQVYPGFRLDWYATAVTDPLYRAMLRNTLAVAVPSTAFSLLGGYVVAYYLVFHAGRWRMPLLALVIVSMLASYLARVYAWRTLMGERGIINSALLATGAIDEPLGFLLFSRFAVVVAQINLLLPFCALLFFAALSSVAPELKEVANDLGAGRWQTQRRVVMPLVGKTILAAATLTFFSASGDYITPQLLGGPSAATIGTAIAIETGANGNYPFGAALAFTLVAGLVVFAGVLWAVLRSVGLLPRQV